MVISWPDTFLARSVTRNDSPGFARISAGVVVTSSAGVLAVDALNRTGIAPPQSRTSRQPPPSFTSSKVSCPSTTGSVREAIDRRGGGPVDRATVLDRDVLRRWRPGTADEEE